MPDGQDQEADGGAATTSASPGSVDARGAVGVQVGDSNTQIVYTYNQLTWTDGVAPPPLATVTGHVQSPYRGLAAFDERDAAFYFGREEATGQVLTRMRQHWDRGGVLVVSGVSGAGKSSLLRAGVLPRLRGAGLPGVPGSERWPCLIFTPSLNPLEELALQVATIGGPNAAELRRELEADPASLSLLTRQAAQQAWADTAAGDEVRRAARVVLLVDQFEQLFTMCPDESQRRAFVAALDAAAAGGEAAAAVVIIGVRADFEARCADYSQLADAVQNRYLVTAMTERQLRMAITGPATAIGASVEPALADTLVLEATVRHPGPDAVSGPATSGAGVLPLVSHALDQAWRMRQSDTLTLADYERAAGIEGAIATSAQRAYEALTPAQQAEARLLFIRLTVPSPDGVDTAGRVATADLFTGRTADQQADVRTVLEAFVAERLITVAAGTVEISHEALLTAWPLLRDSWLAETHADRLVRSRLDTAVREWETHGRDPSYLYSGSLLETASASTDRTAEEPTRFPPLGASATQFLAAGTRAAKRRTNRRRALVVALTVLAVGLASASVVAFRASRSATQQRDAAQQAATVATGRQLAATAISGLETDLPKAMADAIEAYETYPSVDARKALWAAATASPELVRITDIGRTVTSVAASADGSGLAVGDEQGRVTVLAADGAVESSAELFDTPVTGLAVSSGGQRVVATDSHGVQAVAGGEAEVLLDAGRDEVVTVAVSDTGSHTAYLTDAPDGGATLTVVDASGGSSTKDFDGYMRHLVVSDDEVTVLDGGYGSWTRLDLTLSTVLASGDAGFGAHNYAVALSPDGRSFTYTNSASEIPVWVTTGTPARWDTPSLAARGPGVLPQGLALSNDLERLAVLDSGVIYVSEVHLEASKPGSYVAELAGFSRSGVTGMVFLGGSDRLMSASADQVAIWDLRQLSRVSTRQRAKVLDGCVACAGPTVQVSPGSHVAYVTDGFTNPVIHDLDDGFERWWDEPFAGFGPQLWDGPDTLLQGFEKGTIGFIDAATGQLEKEWESSSGRGSSTCAGRALARSSSPWTRRAR